MGADLAALKLATKTVLKDIAKHANALAIGLQNAAPPQDGGPNKSVQYLTETSLQLEELSRSIDGQPTGQDD
jgi:hypothetical protein